MSIIYFPYKFELNHHDSVCFKFRFTPLDSNNITLIVITVYNAIPEYKNYGGHSVSSSILSIMKTLIIRGWIKLPS